MVTGHVQSLCPQWQCVAVELLCVGTGHWELKSYLWSMLCNVNGVFTPPFFSLSFSSSLSEMTLLSTQPKSLDSTPVSAATTSEDPEQRMLEKRSKVIEELLQTEKDYIKDLQMCVKEIIQPLKQKQVFQDQTLPHLTAKEVNVFTPIWLFIFELEFWTCSRRMLMHDLSFNSVNVAVFCISYSQCQSLYAGGIFLF